MNEQRDYDNGEPLLVKVTKRLLERNSLNKRLHWTTIASEKALLAVIGILTLVACVQSLFEMYTNLYVGLPDLFLLFIYAEIIGMIGAFYATSRIPVTLPIIIAVTALCRLIVMQSKETEALVLLAEAGAILVLSCAAYLMSLKDKSSLDKLREIEQRRKMEDFGED
jgi:protein PsiE